MSRTGTLRATSFLLLLTALGGRGWAETAPAPTPPAKPSPLTRFTPAEQKRLLAGEAIYQYVENKNADGTNRGHAQAVALLQAPAEECFRIFTEFNSQHLYFPRKTKSLVVKNEGERYWVEKAFDFYLTTVAYTMIYDVDRKGYRVDFQMDPSRPHDLEDSAGYFLFEPVDGGRTLFTYVVLRVDTGLKVPKFIQDYLTSRDLPAVALNVKKRIESHGQWTKED